MIGEPELNYPPKGLGTRFSETDLIDPAARFYAGLGSALLDRQSLREAFLGVGGATEQKTGLSKFQA